MNAEEFKRVYYPFHPKLYRIAFALLNNAEDAKDILQDTYCKLWSKRNELPNVLQPELFCIRIIRNLCLDFIKAPKNRRDNEQIAFISTTTETTPEQEMESKEKIRTIERIMQQLPEKQRIVIMMRVCSDCSLKEIETAMNESAENVRVLLSRARKNIKNMLLNEQ